ncbi:MAG: serine protein kinase, partial [Deltaproteobacteria bacterium]|nr:serine protein kinase [Deltaproteobacteria bacterium]
PLDHEAYHRLGWLGSFNDYLQLATANPRIMRTAFQRMCHMIVEEGSEDYLDNKKLITHYPFFDDPHHKGKDAVFGLDIPLMRLVNIFKSAARRYGTERRFILLHGPVGSAKSTICRLLKRGLERYSRRKEGALFSFEWSDLGHEKIAKELFGGSRSYACPMREEPLHLLPEEEREKFLSKLNAKVKEQDHHVHIEGGLCPPCRFIYQELLKMYEGKVDRLLEHVILNRAILSEKDRVGIGTFQPKDEKNQDSTELTGDINYRKIAIYGSDSDPRAFNFDGEFNIANRGMIEFIEVLKLDVAFLYDLLGASQEHLIKPKKFAQIDIDEVIIGHTNEPEYRKLQSNEFMEALRDRTVKIDIPYITKLHEEVRIYFKDFNADRVKNKHIAPHTLEAASLWAVLTRLEEPKKANLTLLQKLKLYNGESVGGMTSDNVRELRKEAHSEGLRGISPRYIQDKISQVLVSDRDRGCINPFMILKDLENGLKHHSLISSEDQRSRFRELISTAREECEERIRREVQQAVVADERHLAELCANYLHHVKAYVQREPVRDTESGKEAEPNERLMRSIEEKIDIPDHRKDDFRREVINYVTAAQEKGKEFDFRSNAKLRKALESKLFEDQRDLIALSGSAASSTLDPQVQASVRQVKERLIEHAGYCEVCASDAIDFIASIFARGSSA